MTEEQRNVFVQHAALIAWDFRHNNNTNLMDALLRMADFAFSQCSDVWIKCSKRMPEEGDEIFYWCKTGGNNYRDHRYVSKTDLERMTGDDYWFPVPLLKSEE